jgi:hypothetical protein
MEKAKKQAQGLNVRGFFRLQIGENENGKEIVVGDSGWRKNEVTNLGFQNYICNLIGGLAGSKQVGMVAIGTGTTPGVADTALAGETKRQTCGNAVVSSKTMRATVAIASGDHPGGTPVIQNIGLIENTASGGTLMCGNTYTTSTWNSNQGLSATYELQFATA